MSYKKILDSTLTAIADAIRAKTGNTATMTPTEMPDEIASISGGGGGDDVLSALMEGTASGAITINATENNAMTIILSAGTAKPYNEDVTSFSFPNLTKSTSVNGLFYVETATFVSALTRISMPVCTYLSKGINYRKGYYVLDNLTEFIAPKIADIPTYFIAYAESLEEYDNDSATSIASNAFKGCSALTALILRNTTMATLSDTSALGSTPIEDGTGYIYVPSALLETYQAATNWSTFADQFRAIEDYTDDGTVSGTFVAPTE